ncbi:MAG: AAA family ATPase [Lachnospiraceae bacterium]|nr:AAA family ATPase [Lachnospiraceae bacterium]
MGYGLLGGKLGHSFSPQIHGYLGEYEYKLYETKEDELEAFIKTGGEAWQGLNVTIPYKKAVIPYCDELSETAAKIGSVNTLVMRDGKLVGDNTDYYGFKCMVEKLAVSVKGKKAMVFGNGGAAPTIRAVLEDMGAGEIITISRKENNYEFLSKHLDTALIVNTTPVGMYPNVGEQPIMNPPIGDKIITLADFKVCEAVYDIIFNPLKTRLILDAEELGIPCINGLLMLVAQAKRASEIFRDVKIDDSVIAKIHDTIEAEVRNIMLIGMPGCGKSTIGKMLAEKLGKTFVDADEEIVKCAGKSIPEIFADSGEAEFRRIETEVLAAISKEKNQVVATGGGVVTKAVNKPLLRQNSVVIFIDRQIEELPTDGRPISQSRPLTQIYNERIDAYRAYSDYQVLNTEIEATVDKIMEEL